MPDSYLDGTKIFENTVDSWIVVGYSVPIQVNSELAEWTKAPAWKAGVSCKRYHGFESRTHCQATFVYRLGHDAFNVKRRVRFP